MSEFEDELELLLDFLDVEFGLEKRLIDRDDSLETIFFDFDLSF